MAMLGSYTAMTARAPVSARGAAGAPGPMTSPIWRGAAGDAQDGNEVSRAREQVTAAERAFGGAAPETAHALASLAHVLWGREEFDAALPCAERALAIRLANPGDADLIGVSQYQVGDLRRATGDYAGALLAYRRAIAIWEKTRAPDDSSVGDALHYLGVVDGAIGDTDSARASLARALRIREARLGPWHERVAVTLLALGDLSVRAGDASAAGLFARAQAIAERALGADDPLVARGLSGRAAVLAAAGRLGEARRLVDRALDIRIKTYGPAHHLVGRSRADRAGLLALAGDAAAAEREYSAAIDIEMRALGARHSFVGAMLGALSRVQWAAGEHARALATALEAEDIARDTFRRSSRDLDDEAVLRYGTVRDSGLDVVLTALMEATPPGDAGRVAAGTTAREVADALIRSRALALDVLTRAAPAPDPPGDAAVSGAPADAGPGFEEVRRALPAGSALAAFARFDRIAGTQEAPIATYVALVLRPESDVPATIPIGPASRIDALVAAWRAVAGTDPRSLPDAGADRGERSAGERLREAIWDPLADALAGADRVFLVPDGAIDGVNIAALPSGDGGYLIESGPLLHSLTAERDIFRKHGSARIGKGILIVGDPDFDAPGAPGVVAAANGTGEPLPTGARPECPEFADLVFEPLPGSATEADAIAAAVPDGGVLRLGGAAATRASFVEDAPGRRILHLATHAYVLPEHCGAHRPLLRSGLAFAGANRRAGNGGVGDGILTAEEIATLDLSGVEWVVLSACDTGLGEMRAGEGVVGLRHAFERAGAGTVIMSLWDVDDGAAGAFMRELYAGRRSGLSTSAAMRQAGLGILARQRVLGRSTHPYFWGGFTAVGDWR
jgi:CHAT domain-containing protein